MDKNVPKRGPTNFIFRMLSKAVYYFPTLMPLQFYPWLKLAKSPAICSSPD